MIDRQHTLKALTYFEDGDLQSLPHRTKELLTEVSTDVHEVIEVKRISDRLAD